MGNVIIKVAEVVEVENIYSKDGTDSLRVRAKINDDKTNIPSNIPWAFPLLPKTIQSVPKVGEGVLIITDSVDGFSDSQRYFIGPLISQPQFQTFCAKDNGTTLLKSSAKKPLEKISNNALTEGAFPKAEDIALVGRGQEDIILRFDKSSKASEIDIRAGIREESNNIDNPNMVGNIIFNDAHPAYLQLKFKNGLATKQKYPGISIVNMVGDYINIMSNYDYNVNDSIHDKNTLVSEEMTDEIMDRLHQVPKGDKLVELLLLMKGAIMRHVHPWAGMEQCGDKDGFITALEGYDINSILSDFVRIS